MRIKGFRIADLRKWKAETKTNDVFKIQSGDGDHRPYRDQRDGRSACVPTERSV